MACEEYEEGEEREGILTKGARFSASWLSPLLPKGLRRELALAFWAAAQALGGS